MRAILSKDGSLAFPANYALLYGCASVMIFASAIALSVIREPAADASSKEVLPLRQVLGQLPGIITRDRHYRRVIIVRILGGFAGMASAFYVLNATGNAGLTREAAGLFVSAQVAGNLAGD